MKEIQLSKGYVSLVDDDDFERVNSKKWRLLVVRKNNYAIRDDKDETGEYKSLLMHVFIMGKIDGLTIDHKNHNGCDNQRHNLRYADMTQQNANTIRSQGSSKHKGVHWHKVSKKWVARIKKHGVRVRLGSFDNENDAAIAYNTAAVKEFGEFAYLNVI